MKCRPCKAADETAVVAARVTLNRYLWDWVTWGHGNCTGCPCDHQNNSPSSAS